jgi:hypothetical protein
MPSLGVRNRNLVAETAEAVGRTAAKNRRGKILDAGEVAIAM